MATHELEITTMAHGGSGIGRIDGRVVFTPGVIPGEIVEVEIVEDSKKSLWRAQPLRVLSPSPHRVPHIWPEADISRPWSARAGGADYGHINLSHQRTLKTEILRDSLLRFGGLEGDLVDSSRSRVSPVTTRTTVWPGARELPSTLTQRESLAPMPRSLTPSSP